MRRLINLLFIVASLLTVGIAFFAFFVSAGNPVNNDDALLSYSDDWELPDGGGFINLAGEPYPEGTTEIIVSKTLPNPLPSDAVLYMRSQHNAVELSVDGEPLNVEGVFYNGTFGIDYVGVWIVAPLSEGMAGKTITLDIAKSDGNRDRVPEETLIASKNALTLHLANKSIIPTAIACFMIMLAFGIFVASFFLKRHQGLSVDLVLFWLAVFIFLSAFWMFMDDNVVFIFAPYNDACYFLSFYSFMLLPIPFSLFIAERIPRSRMVMQILSCGFLLAFFLSVIAAIGFAQPLSLMLPLTHFFIVAGLVATFAYVWRDRDVSGVLRVPELAWGLSVFVVAVVGAIVAFYFGAIQTYSILFKCAIFAFVLTLSWGALNRALLSVNRALSFEQLSQTIPCGICRLNYGEEFSIAYANDYLYRMFGYEPDEPKQQGLSEFDYIFYPEDRQSLRQELLDRIQEGMHTFEIETRARHKSGALIYLLTTNNYLPEQNEIVSTLTDITLRKTAEDKLRVSEMEFRVAAEQSEKYIMRYDIKGRCLYANIKAVAKFGMPKRCEEPIEEWFALGLVNQNSRVTQRKFFEAIHRGDAHGLAVLSLRPLGSAAYRWYHFDFTTVCDKREVPDQAVISFYDVTDQREKELAYERLIQSSEMIAEDQVTTFECNLSQDEIEKVSGKLVGTLPRRSGLDAQAAEYGKFIHEDERAQVLEILNRVNLTKSFYRGVYTHDLEFRLMHEGAYRWYRLSVQVVKYVDNDDLKAFVVVRDINEKKVKELRLIERSEIDGLTGILNRSAFEQKFTELVERDRTACHALVMMDIDHFKDVNDTEGHAYGDHVLRDVAQDVRGILRQGDIVGRLGGDEFVFCLANIRGDKELASLLERLRSCLDRVLTSELRQSVSIGATLFCGEAPEFSHVYHQADLALYRAKRGGRNQVVLFDPQEE
ncbi:MAG: diguanylate cyclase [Gordonibacter sp.]|nr:diguanylate cyclase [Gordonibacter sp.]